MKKVEGRGEDGGDPEDQHRRGDARLELFDKPNFDSDAGLLQKHGTSSEDLRNQSLTVG